MCVCAICEHGNSDVCLNVCLWTINFYTVQTLQGGNQRRKIMEEGEKVQRVRSSRIHITNNNVRCRQVLSNCDNGTNLPGDPFACVVPTNASLLELYELNRELCDKWLIKLRIVAWQMVKRSLIQCGLRFYGSPELTRLRSTIWRVEDHLIYAQWISWNASPHHE